MTTRWPHLIAIPAGMAVLVVVLNEVLTVDSAIEPTPAAVDALAPSPAFSVLSLGVVVCLVLFMAGILPIPVGYDRGKVKWLTWCGTGMHTHVCYWHGGSAGLQSIHPRDLSEND